MGCRQWVDQGHIACNAWTDQVSATCVSWRDAGYSKCNNWADEGSSKCSSWADKGSNQCKSKYLNECHWYSPWNCIAGWICTAYYWVANWVCQAWYWVAKWVCKAWYWVANLVCQAFAYFIKAVCLLWSWVAKLICVSWDGVRCTLKGLFGGRRRSRSPIKHVFVLMLENRAFDHMLGFSGIVGTDADTGQRRAVDGATGSNAFNGMSFPPSTEADFKLNKPADVDPGHEFPDTVVALCGAGVTYPDGGAYPPIDNSGFIANYAASNGTPQNPPQIMKCYSPKRVPIINALAAEFALCDGWFSSLPGPTWPNRFFMHAASSGGLDDSPSGLSSAGNTAFDGYTFNNGTIFDRLDDACLEWRVFAGDSFPVTLALSGMTLNELQGRIHDFDEFAEAVNDKGFSTAYTFIEPNYGNDLPPTAQDFTCGNSQHPLDDITRGERLIKSVYETIRNSPHWNNSLLLVTYDEHGGFYDHVRPPQVTPPGDGVSDADNVFHHFRFDRLGVRVPAVVISPLIPKNLVDGTTYDHSSLLATIESIFGLKPLTRRDGAAKNLVKLLSLSTPRADAPTDIGQPAVSGFTCDGDPGADRSSSTAGALTSAGSGSNPTQPPGGGDGPGEHEWTRDPEPVGSTLQGFQEIALLKALNSARGRDQMQIRKEYLAARTRMGAKYFMNKVAMMTKDNRTSAVAARRAGFLSLFRSPPQLRWMGDPINLYLRASRQRPEARPPNDTPPASPVRP
jgi:phospholipase C